MGLLNKLFAKDKPNSEAEETATTAAVMEPPPCLHGILAPQWDNATDMGHEDRITHFVCESCHQSFSPEDAEVLRNSMAERLIGQEAAAD